MGVADAVGDWLGEGDDSGVFVAAEVGDADAGVKEGAEVGDADAGAPVGEAAATLTLGLGSGLFCPVDPCVDGVADTAMPVPELRLGAVGAGF